MQHWSRQQIGQEAEPRQSTHQADQADKQSQRRGGYGIAPWITRSDRCESWPLSSRWCWTRVLLTAVVTSRARRRPQVAEPRPIGRRLARVARHRLRNEVRRDGQSRRHIRHAARPSIPSDLPEPRKEIIGRLSSTSPAATLNSRSSRRKHRDLGGPIAQSSRDSPKWDGSWDLQRGDPVRIGVTHHGQLNS